jgi:hypothetical protein
MSLNRITAIAILALIVFTANIQAQTPAAASPARFHPLPELSRQKAPYA